MNKIYIFHQIPNIRLKAAQKNTLHFQSSNSKPYWFHPVNKYTYLAREMDTNKFN